MIRSEKAVSEVIGMVLIFGIMMLVIGSIMLVAVPMIESGKERARMDVAATSFLSLQNDIEEVVRGPIWVKDPFNVNISRLGPSRETEFQLMGGSLNVFPKSTTNLRLNMTNETSTKAFDFTIGEIDFTANNEKIAYENGAVIRKYESGAPLIRSDPLITIYNTLDKEPTSNISVSIHAINIRGTLSSVGGDGKALIEIRPRNYTQKIEPTIIPNVNRVNITIYTNYPAAWEAFFEKKLNGTGLKKSPLGNTTGYYISPNPQQSPLDVQIYGSINSNKNDILLSVYETELDVKVR